MSLLQGIIVSMSLTQEISPQYGEVFTRRWVVDAILDLIGYTTDKQLATMLIVEPSVGCGAFVGPVVQRLIDSCGDSLPGLDVLRDAIRGYDLQVAHVESSRKVAVNLLERAGVATPDAESLAESWINVADFLLDDMPSDVDFVAGNPPYIRSEDLDDVIEKAYRKRWSTMRGRADIYVGFYERALGMLKKGGTLGYICADRWMRNTYGADLRAYITDGFAVQALWQMHDVNAFEAEVSAYPAITVIRRDSQGRVALLEATGAFGEPGARQALEFAKSTSLSTAGPGFKAHRTDGWFSGSDLWPAGDPDRLALIEDLNERFEPLEDSAKTTRIGIGVATGADRAFIIDSSTPVEPDRALPLVMADDIRKGELKWRGKFLANPWAEDGSLVSLEDYPLLGAHLGSHPAVSKRFIVKKDAARWHRTIDKVDYSLVSKPKLLLQDMKASIQPVLEPGGLYPHHNLYYIVSAKWDLEVLGGLLLSRVAQAFIEAYCVRMRGGTLRFQAQYLRKIRVPDPDSIAPEVQKRLVDAFRARDVEAATCAAEAAYGLQEGTL